MNKHLKSAKSLLQNNDTTSFIYACLELRFAIEKIVSEKIAFHSNRHGKKLLYSDWRPNKVLKILSQIEPIADQSCELSVSENDNLGKPTGRWITMGKHEALTAAWVTKNWNKLGSYLHWKESNPNFEKLKKSLENIIKEIERAESSTLILNSPEKTVSFDCSLCRENIFAYPSVLKDIKEVHCLNQKCDATYLPSKDKNGNWVFQLISADFKCSDCGCKNYVPTNKLAVGNVLKCAGCNALFSVSSHNFSLKRKTD